MTKASRIDLFLCLMTALPIVLGLPSRVVAQPPAAGDQLEDRFKRLDRNGDGKLGREEVDAIPGLKAGFDYIDANHDGGISLEEMKAAMAWWRQRRSEKEEPPAEKSPPKRVAPRVARKPPSTRPAAVDANSPQFRGPRGDGVAYGTNLPVTWSATTNVAWTCNIPGKGWSSPVVWGDRVFVTSAIGPGSIEAPPEVRGLAENTRGVATSDEHQYMLHCVDWSTGKLLWSRCAHKGVPPGSIHPKNTYASETPVTDGERVYAYFGMVGVFCYDMAGRPVWSRDLGAYRMFANWGTASSPALEAGRLFVLCDNEQRSFLVALDSRTGDELWRVSRDERSTWSTPIIWRNSVRTELVVMGGSFNRAYDPAKGKELWRCASERSLGAAVGRSRAGNPPPRRGSPGAEGRGGSKPGSGGCKSSPVADGDLLFAGMSSTVSDQELGPMWAIKAGASGNISLRQGETSNTGVAWFREDAGPHFTSVLVHGGRLYVFPAHIREPLNCFDAKTGKTIYQVSLPGAAGFKTSPFLCDGKIFCIDEDGTCFVVDSGPDYKLLARNRIQEMTWSSPAIVGNSLYLRTVTALYCIGR